MNKLLIILMIALLSIQLASAVTKDCLKNDLLKPELEQYFTTGSSHFTASELKALLDVYTLSGGVTEVSLDSIALSPGAKAFATEKCGALLKNIGDTCSFSAECKSEFCRNYQCAPAICVTDADCATNERCISLERGFLKRLVDSITSLFGFQSSAVEKSCIAQDSYLKSSGEQCQANSECESDFCFSGSCSARPCVENNECSTGKCAATATRIFSSSPGTQDSILASQAVSALKQLFPQAQTTITQQCASPGQEGSPGTDCKSTVSYKACGGLGY